jgi:hypothetical protein
MERLCGIFWDDEAPTMAIDSPNRECTGPGEATHATEGIGQGGGVRRESNLVGAQTFDEGHPVGRESLALLFIHQGHMPPSSREVKTGLANLAPLGVRAPQRSGRDHWVGRLDDWITPDLNARRLTTEVKGEPLPARLG